MARRKILARHLLRADLMRDVPTRLRAVALVEAIMQQLSDFDDMGATASAETGAGGEYAPSLLQRLRRRLRYFFQGPPSRAKVAPGEDDEEDDEEDDSSSSSSSSSDDSDSDDD